MYTLFKLKPLTHFFIVFKIGEKFEKTIKRIRTDEIKETNNENSGFVFFKITQIETAKRDIPNIENIMF